MKKNKKQVMKEARKEGESFMEESKEINFEAPGVKPPKRKYDLGGLTDGDPVKGALSKEAPKPNPADFEPKEKKLIQSSENGTNDPMSQDKFMAKKGGAISKFKAMAAAGKKKMGGKKC